MSGFLQQLIESSARTIGHACAGADRPIPTALPQDLASEKIEPIGSDATGSPASPNVMQIAAPDRRGRVTPDVVASAAPSSIETPPRGLPTPGASQLSLREAGFRPVALMPRWDLQATIDAGQVVTRDRDRVQASTAREPFEELRSRTHVSHPPGPLAPSRSARTLAGSADRLEAPPSSDRIHAGDARVDRHHTSRGSENRIEPAEREFTLQTVPTSVQAPPVEPGIDGASDGRREPRVEHQVPLPADVVVEHLDIRIVPAPRVPIRHQSARRSTSASASGAWATAARHYISRL